MDVFWAVDWNKLFGLEISILEVFLRGSVIFLCLFVLFRIFRREMGAIGISDVLVVVLVANAAENGLSGGGESVTESILLVCTIVFWDRVFDYLEHRFEFLAPLFRPRALVLIENGKMNRRNMRRELVTEEELRSQLRLQGIENIEDVKKCMMEGDGSISVIKNESSKNENAGDNAGNDTTQKKKVLT